jgi:hypothetical protein
MNKPPPDVAVSIANLRLEADHAIKADIPYASARPSDILAVCAAAERAEAELATAKATIELLNGRATIGSELFQGSPEAKRIEKGTK